MIGDLGADRCVFASSHMRIYHPHGWGWRYKRGPGALHLAIPWLASIWVWRRSA
jgi:hypothetical protein